MDVLLVGSADELPVGVGECLAANQWRIQCAQDFKTATEKAGHTRFDAVVLGGQREEPPWRDTFLRYVNSQRIAAVIVGGNETRINVGEGSLIDVTGGDVSKEEISWRLSALSRFQVHLRRMEQELENMQRLGKRLNQHFREIDDEMRLASRLQRDFLPRDVKQVGPLSFGTIYRPATWVSGDIYDIARLDENHVGFYIADAVGHGMAAGLLTMFIKRALVTKRISDGCYEILDPSESLQLLNDTLAEHTLPNCQFVTALYCVVNTETLTMRYARGGHPYPLLLGKESGVTQLKSPGGLMGLFPDIECPSQEVQLHPGDKIILYTDGIEAFFDHVEPASATGYSGHLAVMASLSHLGAAELIAQLNGQLDRERGSLLPDDDITVVAVEVAAGGD